MVTFLDFYLRLCNALPMAVLSHEIISLPKLLHNESRCLGQGYSGLL